MALSCKPLDTAGCPRTQGGLIRRLFRALLCAPAALATLVAGRSACAEPVSYRIDAARSFMELVPAVFDQATGDVLSGSRVGNLVGIVHQEAAGSGRAMLAGMLAGELAGGVLTLAPQSSMIALENPAGPFVPSPGETGSPGMVDNLGGRALAYFGGQFTPVGMLAVRDFAATVIDASLTVGGAAESLSFDVYAGVIDELVAGDPNFELIPEEAPDSQPNISSQSVIGSLAGTIEIPFRVDVVVPVTLPIFGVQQGHIIVDGRIVAVHWIPGDFDGNRQVDSADLTVWKAALGVSGAADADADGDSDAADFLIWQRHAGAGSVAAVAAPEPRAILLAIAAWMAALATFSRATPARPRR